MHWLRLIRWSNLLIIFLTQGVAWWCVIYPLQEQTGAHILLRPGNFLLLTVSTMLIAAAGYIINDYFDIRIDAINKPDAVILEKTIPRRSAIIVHSALNAMALLLAGIVAWQARHLEWLLIQAACIVMLWRYSTTWKRQFMIGNVIVALMTALTVFVLMLYEPAVGFVFATSSVVPGWHTINVLEWNMPVLVLFVFALFAFILTWMREIIKDMEDYKGDDAEGCLTMPIKWGMQKTLRFVQGLGATSILLLAGCCYVLNKAGMKISESFLFWIIVAVMIPLIIWTKRATVLRTKPQFTKASRQLKWIMISGIISLLFFRSIGPAMWDSFFTQP